MQSSIKKVIYGVVIVNLLPLISFAEQLGQTKIFFGNALSIVRSVLIPLVFTLALLLFFWGVVKYIRSEGDGKEDGRRIMIWGIIALFVMASIWGLVAFLQKEIIGTNNPTSVPIPSIGGGSGSGGGGDCNPAIYGATGECR